MKIRAAVQGWQEWTQWIRSGYNWRNFTLVACRFETATYMGKEAELELGLLGFNLRVSVWDQVSRDVAMTPITETIKRIEDGTEKVYEVCTHCWQTIEPKQHWLNQDE